MQRITGDKTAILRPRADAAGRAGMLFFSAALVCASATWRCSAAPMSGGALSLRRNLISAGGTVSSASGLSLNGALAEAAVSGCAGGNFRFSPGFMPLAAQPGTVAAITAVSKTTGTLELAWSAPGLDGFIGRVDGGFYRIDATSEPDHVFAPTTFTTEFSTSVTPGEPQFYTLRGLEPNTTYYTRIYLADGRRAAAETSAPSEESTRADLPVSPVLTGVYYSSASFSWALPASPAAGWQLDGSSTAFGALFPGGIMASSATGRGAAVSLAVTGLRPHTVYYFRLGSLNWQQEINFDTVIAAKTLGYPLPIRNLAALQDPLARKIRFTWSNPDYPGYAGVLVQASTNPITAEAADGEAYSAGAVFPDGSVALAGSAGYEQLHAALELDTTYYYRFTGLDSERTYSFFVSTESLLDLPPMSPAGLRASLDLERSSITLGWNRVASNIDGSPFRRAAEPLELARYEIYRATGIVMSSWTLAASVPVSASSATLDVPDPDSDYFYKVEAMDSFGKPDAAMVVDTRGNVYAVAPDRVSRLKIPAALAGSLLAEGNPSGRPLFFRAAERPQDLGGRVVKSVNFEPVQSPSGESARFRLEKPEMEVVLRYDSANGHVVTASGANPAPAVGVSDAPYALGSYFFNGAGYAKVFGAVDARDQTVTVRSALPGVYQIRSLARSSGVSFDVREMSNKVITPNGDGLNDYVAFTLDNPRDSAFSGKIYDLSGAFVAEMRPGSQMAGTLTWDGKSGGRTAPRGVYIYQIKAEGKTFNGTIVVIR